MATLSDQEAIEAVISRQFGSLNWDHETAADWEAFAADFLPDASLIPSARPAGFQSVRSFVERMKGLAKSTLRSFHEEVIATKVTVFGNIAVASVAVEMTENGSDRRRNVEMMLLVKTDGEWRIASQAWDRMKDSSPLPDWF